MAHALLLSPDDQAVTAISGVLEEMSVTWERPLDGPSAAKKLNSQSFDLVLVDCENLPAAKLIFDVCRRPRTGGNPVPIAIVDGRAGLPTAFRLGAELILTKPVAKDQARTTIRTAVNRIKKEESARPLHLFEEPAPPALPAPEPRAQAAAAAASSGALQPVEPAIPVAPVQPVLEPPAPTITKMAAVTSQVSAEPASPKLVPPMARDLTPPQSFAPPAKLPTTTPVPPKPADDPVLADLESEMPTPVFSSYKEKVPKKSGRGSLLLLLLILAGGGFYAAWMYQPGFREMVQPWFDKAIALIPNSRQSQNPAPPKQPVKPTNSAVHELAPANAQSAPVPATEQTGLNTTTAPDAGSVPAGLSTLGPTNTAETNGAVHEKQASNADSDAKTEISEKKTIAAAPSDTELAGEKDAVILSSRGAENRLVHHVAPTYPAEARREKLEGTVVLKALISESGTVSGVRLVEGNPTLATAAIHAVKQWRYRPYFRNGKSLPFQTVVLVEFQRR